MKSHNHLISIIIPAYNQAKYLPHSIDSALVQTYRCTEIIVVDDGSTDDTAKIARGYQEKIRYIHQENRGLAGARNSGIRAAKGKYVALLDADDLWLPNFLEIMSMAIDNNSESALYYCAAQCIDERGALLPQQVGFFDTINISTQELHKIFLRTNFLIPSTIILNRQIALDTGLFDESLQSIGLEDWDLWLRLLPGNKFTGLANSLVRYRIHQKSLSANPVRMQNSKREVIEKHFGFDDGNYIKWSDNKRRAYGGMYRYFLISSIQRKLDWEIVSTYLKKALLIDPTLAYDLDMFFELSLGNQPIGYRGTNQHLSLDENIEGIFQAISKIFNKTSNENLKKIRNKVYGTAHFAVGLLAYNTSERIMARKNLLKALYFRPRLILESRVSLNLIKTTLNKQLFSFLQKTKNPFNSTNY